MKQTLQALAYFALVALAAALLATALFGLPLHLIGYIMGWVR